MRVISGEAKGCALKAPKGIITRPTSDRVKEGIFNVLAPYIEGSLVLDAFAGSGGLSIECISRGAALAVLIEKNAQAIMVIKENLAKVNYTGQAQIIKADVFSALSQMERKFDIIFLDPPYNKGLIEPVIAKILKQQLLAEYGIIVVETNKKKPEPENVPEQLIVWKDKKYGDTNVFYYKYTDK